MIADELQELMMVRADEPTKGATANYRKAEAMVAAVMRSVGNVTKLGWRGRAPTDADAQALARDAKALHDLLDITAERPSLARGLKKKLGKVRNFRKMLSQYAKVKTGEELHAVLKSQTTKSKDAWDKLRDYGGYALAVIGGLDAEVESTLHIGRYRVTLVTALHREWTRDLVEKLKQTLTEVDRRLARIGMSGVSGGAVYAWPSAKLPPSASLSHNAIASYTPKRDSMNLAAASPNLLDNTIHELGHRAYFKLVEGRGRTAWSEFFERHTGAPNLDAIVRRWESFAAKPSSGPYSRYLGHYLHHLQKEGDGEDTMWLQLVADNVGIDEKFNPYTGAPRGRKTPPGLDQLLAKKAKAKVFLHPVTAYSGTSPEELFAETFSEYAVRGPRRVPPIVRIAFKRTIPSFREHREAGLAAQLQEAASVSAGCPAKVSELVKAVRSKLTDDLREPKYQGNPSRSAGHCYVASEALYHLLGGRKSGWVPMQVSHEGVPHWYLFNEKQGCVADATSDQFKSPVPRDKAKGKGFLTAEPSARARELMGRVRK